MRFTRIAGSAAIMAAALLVSHAAQAQCSTIGGKGTGSTADSARFQAYEAMLQGTDWGMWATWMTSGAKVGTAPGYAVKGLKFRCKPGGWGMECLSQATFCKRA
ncbi:MAG TPA: hypothetical protein VFR19_22240 [Hyphomicrobiaceae bacterium]|jgi:hypothetical protein|nr:hypothetical protein [Hyphomicrobiaceae bacterium]